jgi:hypothetical protein
VYCVLEYALLLVRLPYRLLRLGLRPPKLVRLVVEYKKALAYKLVFVYRRLLRGPSERYAFGRTGIRVIE